MKVWNILKIDCWLVFFFNNNIEEITKTLCRRTIKLLWKKSWHFLTPPLVSREMKSEERVQKFHAARATTQIGIVLLIGWSKFLPELDQSEAPPRSGQQHVISMEFLRSFFRRHFTGGDQWLRRKMSAIFLAYEINLDKLTFADRCNLM